MTTCCSEPRLIILANGHRQCRNCGTDLDVGQASADHEYWSDGIGNVPCKWCGVPYKDHAKTSGVYADR